MLSVQVVPGLVWRRGRVHLLVASGYESLLVSVSRTVIQQLPDGYEMVIHRGSSPAQIRRTKEGESNAAKRILMVMTRRIGIDDTLAARHAEVLKEAVPKLHRLAIFAGAVIRLDMLTRNAQEAARSLGIEVLSVFNMSRAWLDSWSGIGVVERGMARQGYDLQLTRYANEGWRATFYVAGREHSKTQATGSAWESTPWRAVQGAAWETLKKLEPAA